MQKWQAHCANIVFFSNSAMEFWLRWKLKKDTGSGSYAFLIDTLHAQYIMHQIHAEVGAVICMVSH